MLETLKIIFQADQTGSIKIDGTKKTSTGKVLTESIAAGAHQLTKADSRNIYYMALYDFATPTDVESIKEGVQAVKVLRDGRVLIQRGEQMFTIDGRRVK